MNREIKFRAWDGDIKQMLPEVDTSSPSKAWKWLGAKDVVLLQFTGLRDADGKDIYEGDIVRGSWKRTGGGELQAMVVVYQAPEFVMKTSLRAKTWATFLFAPSELQHYHVIGNVFENRDLIKTARKDAQRGLFV